MQAKCSATMKAGAPCRALAMSAARYCVTHDPARVTDLAEWRRRGGEGKSNKARAKKALPGSVLTPAEVQGLLGLTLRGVLAGTVEPGVANAAANLGRAIVAVREATTLEERLAALEAAAEAGGWSA